MPDSHYLTCEKQTESASRNWSGMLSSTNPATGHVIGEVPLTDVASVQRIIARARQAQSVWAEMPLKQRCSCLQAFRSHMLAQIDVICRLVAREQGRPTFETLSTEILPVTEILTYYTSHAARFLSDRHLPLSLMHHRRSYLHYAPLGVIGIITPWNYPFSIPLSETIPALLAGNAVVLKPSELTPLTSQFIAELFASSGLPEGTFQVMQGDGRVGAALVQSGVDKIVFTGGRKTARQIFALAAETLTPVQCELGGKDALIVCADADIERAAQAAVWGAFANAGQICASVERVFVPACVAESFIARAVALTRTLRVGPADGRQPVEVGPLISEAQLEIVEQQVQDALEKGAQILTGGRRLPDQPGPFYLPTILVNLTPDMTIMQEETFGPVLPIFVTQDEEEAIRLTNASSFGLNAYVFGRNRKHVQAIARRLEVGTVMINDLIVSYGAPETPWGGVKQSGHGRVHGGAQGIHLFCQERHIMVDRFVLKQELWWFPYSRLKYFFLEKAIQLLYFIRRT